MANAVVAGMQGHDYQARFFWEKACRLFDVHSKVVRVGYDVDTSTAPRAFDDVVVWYGTPILDGRGGKITTDYYQVKFHVSYDGAFTAASLMDPALINASSVSLLQRLKNAQEHPTHGGDQARFWIVSPWSIDPGDELSKIVSATTGELRLNVLFDGTTDMSAMGKIRKAWREHLGLASNTELECVLRPLHIRASADSLSSIQDRLNDRLLIAGLKPVSADVEVHPYDDLIKKLRAAGTCEFSRADLEAICQSNGLWTGKPVVEQPAVQVGLRSFMRWAEHMEDDTEQMLCLVPHFDGRAVRDLARWSTNVFPDLAAFVEQTMRPEVAYHLHIDAHASIAFAAGYCLDPKSGTKVSPVQKTGGKGRSVWDCDGSSELRADRDWAIDEISLNTGGTDVAVAICVTHDVVEDAHIYIEQHIPSVGRLLCFRMQPAPGAKAIVDGAHARCVAQTLSTALKASRTTTERKARLHLFAAAPNALLFFIGQHSRSFGQFTLYEYDFDSSTPGAYQPSLHFPPAQAPATTKE